MNMTLLLYSVTEKNVHTEIVQTEIHKDQTSFANLEDKRGKGMLNNEVGF